MSPYLPLEVIETFSKAEGYRAFVRDTEESHIFLMVEYINRRLTCWCDDGQAHAESPDTEAPCVHLSAVVDHRMEQHKASGPPLGVLRPSVFVD